MVIFTGTDRQHLVQVRHIVQIKRGNCVNLPFKWLKFSTWRSRDEGRQTGRYERTAGCSPGNTEHGKLFLINAQPLPGARTPQSDRRGRERRERREKKMWKERLGIYNSKLKRRNKELLEREERRQAERGRRGRFPIQGPPGEICSLF